MTVYQGSCHCASVRFCIDTDEPLGPYFRCDCSLCSRKGAVMGEAARCALQLTCGGEQLVTYTWNSGEALHHFCKLCGIYTHHVMRGATERIGVNMACIDGFDVATLADVEWGGGSSLPLVGPATPPRRP